MSVEACVARPKNLLPRARGWLRRLMPMTGESAGGLWYLMNEAEMMEIIANAPQVGRILRPLCRILDAPLPPGLMLPKRVRVGKKDTSSPALRGRRGGAAADDGAVSRYPDGAVGETSAEADVRRQTGRRVGFPPLPKDYVPPKDWE